MGRKSTSGSKGRPASKKQRKSAGRKAGGKSAIDMAWVDHYPPKVKWDAPLPAQSLPDMFDTAVGEFSARTCTNFLGAELTFAEIGEQCDRLAAGLQERGYGRGQRIGLFLPNCPYYVAAYYAILKIGATVVNFNPLYTVDELMVQARDAGISAIVSLDLARLLDKAMALADKGLVEHVIVCDFAACLPTLKGFAFKVFKGREIANTSAYGNGDAILRWEKLTANDGRFTPAIINPESDIALLQYTGGTTGTPKGAMLTHANLTVNVEQILAWSQDVTLENERVMGILPFFHVFAMTTVLNFAIRTGAMMILMPKFEAADAIKLMRKHHPTIFPGVPTLYNALLTYEGIRRADLEQLKLCISGGAPLPLELRRKFEAFSGVRLIEGYGLTETSPVATCNPLTGLEKDNSIGQPVPGTIVSARSLEDPKKVMARGEAGELCIKGPQVMVGYWNNDKATKATFVGDYFRTGDVGYMDDEGFFYIIDRIKDMINASGFKVYPRRIEDAIYEHPAVDEVTVIGIEDEYRGEAPKAFIKLKPGHTATAEDILEHLKSRLSKIEMPEEIEFRDELPKTMIGKLSKKELRQQD